MHKWKTGTVRDDQRQPSPDHNHTFVVIITNRNRRIILIDFTVWVGTIKSDDNVKLTRPDAKNFKYNDAALQENKNKCTEKWTCEETWPTFISSDSRLLSVCLSASVNPPVSWWSWPQLSCSLTRRAAQVHTDNRHHCWGRTTQIHNTTDLPSLKCPSHPPPAWRESHQHWCI